MGARADALVEVAGELLGVLGAGHHGAEVLDDADIGGRIADRLQQYRTLKEFEKITALGLCPMSAVGAVAAVTLDPGHGVLERHGVDDGGQHVVRDHVRRVDVFSDDEVRDPSTVDPDVWRRDARGDRGQVDVDAPPRMGGVVILGVRRLEVHGLVIREGGGVVFERVETGRNLGFNVGLAARDHADREHRGEQTSVHGAIVYAEVAVNGVYV